MDQNSGSGQWYAFFMAGVNVGIQLPCAAPIMSRIRRHGPPLDDCADVEDPLGAGAARIGNVVL